MYRSSFKSYTKGAFGETTRYCSCTRSAYAHSAYCTYSNNNIVDSADVACCLSAVLLSALVLIGIILVAVASVIAISAIVLSIIAVSIIVRLCVDVRKLNYNYKPINIRSCL